MSDSISCLTPRLPPRAPPHPARPVDLPKRTNPPPPPPPRPGRVTHFFDPASELQALIRRATENGEPLEESFSRKRGFRKKIKKTGSSFNSRGKGGVGKTRERSGEGGV